MRATVGAGSSIPAARPARPDRAGRAARRRARPARRAAWSPTPRDKAGRPVRSIPSGPPPTRRRPRRWPATTPPDRADSPLLRLPSRHVRSLPGVSPRRMLGASGGTLMLEDLDPAETREWLEALDSVLAYEGADRAFFLLDEVVTEARRKGAPVPYSATTPYLNTIPPQSEDRPSARELALDHRIRSLIRWNALAMVLRANAESSELGGHIASFQSAATLYDVGFQHFFHAASDGHGGDLLFIQGHSSPGIYARSFVEGRLSGEQLTKFRQETGAGNGQGGLSSYPHPWLMPDYWQMPTVSMGLGPIMAIYQARFLKYLACRGLADTSDRKVWAFLGDGETDEPESLGAIALASREKLDNLIFVINCNLQRLDGPVRGNGKIIQELEGIFRGAG